MKHQPMRPARGFTLIELIVTLVILGGLMAALMPSAANWLRSLRVRSAAESVRNGMEIARMEALKRNTLVSFWLVSSTGPVPDNTCVRSSTSAGWVVSVQDPSGSCAATASQTAAPQLVQHSTAAENASDLVVAGAAADGTAVSQVTFNGFGQVVQGASPMQIVDVSASVAGGRRLRVMAENGGAIRMCDLDAVAPDSRACPSL